MSICPYNNKNQKSNPSNTPTNSSTKTSKDERPGSNFPSKGPARRQQQISFDNKKGYSSNSRNRPWKHQHLDNFKRDQRFEKYASGGSFVSADGKVKDGSKKTLYNHLLNFKYEPRQFEDVSHSQWSPPKRRDNRPASSFFVFNKERFLQANSRFITKRGDYSIQSTDPDAPIPWENVEKVLLHRDDDIPCPICLYPPAVPKVTKCGHVYCWSCILHYLALDEKRKNARDCPICAMNVRKSDLRSVSFLEASPLHVGGVFKMNLMFREHTSLVPKPIAQLDGDAEMNWSRNGTYKIEEYSPVQVLECIVNPELEMLDVKLSIEMDELERDFLNCAILDCKNRQADLLSQISVEDNLGTHKATNTKTVPSGNKERAMEVEMNSVCIRNPSDTNDGFYYFYQIEGGQNIFLDGINVKCLLKEFSNFKNCPPVLEAPILHIESFIMTEDLRKRHKYLSHLPLSCEYQIAELDLRSPLLSQETLDEFQDMINRRLKNRQLKEKLENDSKRRAEIAEQRKVDLYVRDNSFTCTESEFVAGSAFVDIKSGRKEIDFPVGSLTSESSDMSLSPPTQTTGSMSFAQKLRTGEASTYARPLTMKTTAERDSFMPTTKIDDGDDDDDSSYRAPTYQSSFCDALNASLDRLKSKSADVAEASLTENGGSGKRKNKKTKKKKQQLLFSTSAHMRP